MQCAKFRRSLHRTRAKNAEIRSKISKKVRYHLQSFELGPHRSNWRKKPPRTGRFFIIDANNNRKKNAVAVSMKKQTTGGQPQKKNHRRERRIRNPRTQTPIRCQRIYNRSSQGYSAKTSKPNRTPKNEPRWFKPLENDWILIFFCFTHTTSWTRRSDLAYCMNLIFSSISTSDTTPFVQTGVSLTIRTHKTLKSNSAIRAIIDRNKAYLLGLLAKIKCSICSYQLNLWYLLHGNKWD